MKYYMLLRSALIVPQDRAYHPLALGAGAVVRLLPPDEWETSNVSSTTACKNEPYVEYADVVGRLHRGWLARNTVWTPAKGAVVTYLPYDRTEPLTGWDRLREVLASQGWTMPQWITSMKAADRNLARQIIREFGGSVPKSKQNADFKEVLLRLTQAHTKEDRMAKTKTKAAASAKAEAPTVKGEASESRSNSAMGSTAQALRELNVKHPTIAKLEAEKCSSSALAELRDHINELALAAREANKPGRASKLSAVNRSVRKLQRKLAA